MKQQTFKWILFFAILAFFPGIYLLPPLILGVLPLPGMIFSSIHLLPHPVAFAISLINVAAYGYIFYRMASFLTGLAQGTGRKIFYIVILLPVIGFIPMYGVSGHGTIDFSNAYRYYHEAFSDLKFFIWSLRQG
jgi:hypothetical protein